MWIAEFDNYKAFIKAHMKTLPKNGYGQAKKLADHLGISPMVLSHILTRHQHFTADQALRVAAHFGFIPRDTEYFLNMIYMERADSPALKQIHQQKLDDLKREANKIKNVVQGRDELTEMEKATFFSNWYYVAAFVMISIKGYQTVSALSEYLKLSPKKISTIVSFLLDSGLVVEEKGTLGVGKKSIFLPDTSEFLNNHRRNWREIALRKFSENAPRNIFFSMPVSISKKDADEVQKELLRVIADYSKKVADSPEELPMCLNIDWFQF